MLCYLYADMANFKRPSAQESTFYWRCNLMARIAGVDLPREKRVEIGLTYIYGIGVASSKERTLPKTKSASFVNTSSTM